MADQTASQIAGAASDILPTGTVLPFAGSSAPAGYTKALGTKQSETTAKNGLSTAASSVTGSVGGTDGGHGHTMRFRTPSGLGIGGDDGRYMLVGTDTPAGYAQPNMSNGGHGHGFSLSAGAQTISGDAETRPANIAMNYIIKV